MLELIKPYLEESEAAAPLIFGALFLVIVGGALWITPRLARWLDKKDKQNPGYYDGMLEEDPNASGATKLEDKNLTEKDIPSE